MTAVATDAGGWPSCQATRPAARASRSLRDVNFLNSSVVVGLRALEEDASDDDRRSEEGVVGLMNELPRPSVDRDPGPGSTSRVRPAGTPA